MARTELALALARSDAPVPPPEGIVRVPLTGSLPLAGLLGAYLGALLGPIPLFVPPLSALSGDARDGLVPLAMFLGVVPGVLLTSAVARRRNAARTIAFDAEHVWTERPDKAADPLPWAGMRLRGGRVPHLVAEDGRTIPFLREAFGLGPDARYLAALIERLPKITVAPRPPGWVLAFVAALGFAGILGGASLRPPLDAEGPYWSPQRYAFLAALLGGATVFLSALLPLLVRSGMEAEDLLDRLPKPEAPGAEIAAHFRAHRFRPPAVEIEPGRTYRYRESEFWRSAKRRDRAARFLSGGTGIAIFLGSYAAAFLTREERPGDKTLLLFLGPLNLFLMGGVALFTPRIGRAGWTLQRSADRAIVTDDRGRTSEFPWPPARRQEPNAPFDWTDELQAGLRRSRFDRRLLVPESLSESDGP